MKITLIYKKKQYILNSDFNSDLTLAQIIFLNSFVQVRPLCFGLGLCKKCKIIFHSKPPKLTEAEKKVLSQSEQENNVRLACRHRISPELQEVTIELISEEDSADVYENKFIFQEKIHSRLFVDIGTTSIAWQVLPINFEYEQENFKFFKGQDLNPQAIGGADVISRLYNVIKFSKSSSLNYKNIFNKLIYDYLKKLVEQLTLSNIEITEIYLAANPTIMAISLGESVEGLTCSPYFLQDKGNRYLKFSDLAKNALPGSSEFGSSEFNYSLLSKKILSDLKVWIAPQLSAFIGADAIAGFAHIFSSNKKSFLLADMGTNGEFLVWNQKQLIGASVPLGPAIEGLGMRFGAPVFGKAENIILSFSLGLKGLEYICKGEPKSICGAAYLSLIHILLNIGILDRTGNFAKDLPSSLLVKKIAQQIRVVQNEKRFYITDTLYLCLEDIENVLKVKSSFATALEFLNHEDIEHFYLAGSLGEHIPLAHLENLGFLPHGALDKTSILGNTSLKGLIDFAKKENLSEILNEIEQAKVLDLVANSNFSEKFIENMHF